MDILIKLRLYLWIMVLCLWGLMIYQFLEDEEPQLPPQLLRLTDRLHGKSSNPSRDFAHTQVPASQIFPPKPEELLLEPAPPSSGLFRGEDAAVQLRRIPTPSPQAVRVPPGYRGVARSNIPADMRAAPPRPPSWDIPAQRRMPARAPAYETPAPKGFTQTQTPHFIIYAEGENISSSYIETIENIHANLMLDLSAFSPWARDERVCIYLFRSQDSYRRVTGRPSWSGGASSVKGRKIYLYESEESIGILAHELCHIYFDSFFLGGRPCPLWLSEGMATLVQTERGLAAPNWLKENLDRLHRGSGYALTDLISVENTSNAEDASVRLWYAQSYSVVRFLLRAQYKSSFFRFCAQLRAGLPTADALYRAYGMPYNRVKALEYAWRYDLSSRR